MDKVMEFLPFLIPLVIAEFALFVKSRGVPDDVIMDVFFINMGTYNIGMIAFSKTLRQFLSQTIGFLRRNLSRQKSTAHGMSRTA